MRIVVLASGAFAEPTLRWLAKGPHEIALVVTQPARESGRGRRVTPTPVRLLADELGLPCLEAENVNAPETVSKLWSLEARLGLVIAFGQKLGAGVLGAFPAGCINLHASLLPKLRGAAPINWAIARGERETGCTVFRLVERMDAGPILAQSAAPIGTEETAGELHDRLAELGVEVVRDSLALLERAETHPGKPQDESLATHAPKLTKADGVINFDQAGDIVVRHIRAMTPWPGATTTFHAADGRWENVTILRARSASPLDKGELGPASPLPKGGQRGVSPGSLDDQLHIATGDGLLEVLEIKPSSGRAMSWQDYRNGRRVQPDDRFGD
jgi:methionyl-tRNA formyltransferase